MPQTPIKNFLREPLVHFLFIAVLFFVVYDVLNPQAIDDSKRINVSNNRIEQLKRGFEKTWTRAPTEQELEKIIESYALDEIYAREAKALGLDENDEVIRRRLRQKMEFILQDMSILQQPSSQALNDFYQNNLDKYRQGNRYSFEHVYMMTNRSADELEQLITQQKALIAQGETPQSDSSMLPKNFINKLAHQITRQFGIGFDFSLDEAPLNQWSGPIKSGLGLHFIKVSQRTTGDAQPLSLIQERVIKDWRYQQNKQFIDSYQKGLLKQYQINIEVNVNSDTQSNATSIVAGQ